MYNSNWEMEAELEKEQFEQLDEETKFKAWNRLLRDIFRDHKD